MTTPRTGSVASGRQLFADQFERDGNSYIYRRSQKGEAFRVTAEERTCFVDEFDRHMRRATWTIYLATAVAIVAVVLVMMRTKSEVPDTAIYGSLAALVLAYMAYFRWAWSAPARQLSGRTPIARERSADEVRRLTLGRITYGQLAGASAAGLALPFVASSRGSPISGWNRIWLLFAGGIVVLAAVQAFRKWRLEHGDPSSGPVAPSPQLQPAQSQVEDSSPQLIRQLPRYLLFGGFLLFIAFLFTPVGKQWAKNPTFFTVLIVACGGWSLFTVARGFKTGTVRPFLRGSFSTYERESQPYAFWASMGWNTIFTCLCLWVGLQMNQQTGAQHLQERCSRRSSADPLEQAVAPCNEWVTREPRNSRAYLERGIVFLNHWKMDAAIDDFTRAHQLDPASPWPLADRGISYAWKNDQDRARSDFAVVRKTDPLNPVLFRGEAVLQMETGDLDSAIDTLTAQLAHDPSDGWSLQTRADAYQQRGDFDKARVDRNRLTELETSGRAS